MFTTYIVNPIYNAFVFLIGNMPGGDVGLAIIAMTVVIRIVLYPVFTASIRSQMGLQAMQEELEVEKKKLKDNKEALARVQLELMRKYKVNPLALFGSLILQMVAIGALYFAMFHEGFPDIAAERLYSFVSMPEVVNTQFLGFIDLLASKNIIMAVLSALTMYAAIRLTVARTSSGQVHTDKEKAAQQKMQNGLMLYFMPGLLGVLGYFFPAGVGLYFVAGNIFSVGQEILIKRKFAAQVR
jgi:YidC/Oxa1 family membrane protein insertase